MQPTLFLGVLPNKSLCRKPHITAITMEMGNRNGILGKTHDLINTEGATVLYYVCINYCNIAWACTHQTKLEPYTVFRNKL